jgi:RNA polymerase sigma factor (sigma-70 family)
MDTLRIYLNSLKSYKQHSEFETKGLIAKLKRDKEIIIEGNLRLVAKIAMEMQASWTNFDVMDFIQEGNEALMYIVDKFDPSKKAKWSTFLAYCVKMRILQYIQSNIGQVRMNTTRQQRAAFGKLNNIRQELDDGGAYEDIADKYDMDLDVMLTMINANSSERLDDLQIDGPEVTYIKNESCEVINRKIQQFRETLNKRELMIFDRNIYKSELSLQDIACAFDVTRQHIWAQKKIVLNKAKEFFTLDDLKLITE